MYCIKCGKEIPDGEKICQDCAAQQNDQEKTVVQQTPETVQEYTDIETESSVKSEKKKGSKLMIPLIVVCALLIASLAFTVYSYRSISVQKANYRAKEATLSSKEKELSSLQTDYETVCAELETAESTVKEQKATIASMKKEITALEGSASQNEYDITEMQKALEQAEADIGTLTTENESLTAANATLTTEKANLVYELEVRAAEVTSLEDQLSTMTANYNAAKTKVDFMDSYVVFVNNDSSSYYHKYDCSSFTKSNFWAYSRKLAENYGYSACPSCCG